MRKQKILVVVASECVNQWNPQMKVTLKLATINIYCGVGEDP